MIKKYRELPVASSEETKEYLLKAEEFLKTTGLYSSDSSTAAIAIADYMASLDSKQLKRGR